MKRPKAHDRDWTDELPWMRRLAGRLVYDDADADDLVQDAVEHATRSAPRDPASRRGWLASILRNRGRMRHRSEGRRRAREEVAMRDHDPGPRPADLDVHAAAVARALHECLADLDRTDRALLVDRYAGDRDASELAAEHGMPASTVRTRIHRAKARIRRNMDARLGHDARTWAAALGVIPGGGATPIVAGAGAAIVSVGTKVAVAAAIGGVVLAGWWLTRPEAPEIDAAISVAEVSPTQDATRSAAATVDSKPTASDRAKARIERLARIKEARRRRLAGLAADPPPDPPTIGAPTEDEFRREVAAVFEGKSPGFSSTFKPIVEELGSGLLDCLQDVPENARGKIHFTLSLIGEPEVGAVVEELEVHTEGNPDESLVTCGRESVYTALLPDPAESLLDTLNLTIDLDDRELSVGAPMTADNLADILDRYPELLSDVESAATLLASQPELAEAFRALREQDPGLAERFPALDEALPE